MTTSVTFEQATNFVPHQGVISDFDIAFIRQNGAQSSVQRESSRIPTDSARMSRRWGSNGWRGRSRPRFQRGRIADMLYVPRPVTFEDIMGGYYN